MGATAMSKPEVFMHHGYLVTATKHMCKMYHGGTLYVRLTDHEAAMAERDAEIEEWSGTAVQNGMECDRLAAERNELLGLLRDIHNGIHCDTLPGNLYQRLELTLFPGDE